MAHCKDKNEGDVARQRRAHGKKGVGDLKEHCLLLFWGEVGVAQSMASVWAETEDEAA